jgi:hypothetical protein
MSEVNMPLAQVRLELEKLGFRDLPEHLLVSFMESILREEAANSAATESSSFAPATVSETRDGSFLRSNGGSSNQSASATLASAALKTRVSGRKVTILSPSKAVELGPRQTDVQEGRMFMSGLLQQQHALQDHHSKSSAANAGQRRPPAELSGNAGSSAQQMDGLEMRVSHSVPTAQVSKLDLARAAAPTCESTSTASASHFGASSSVCDENTVPASQRLEATNNALRAAIGLKSSSLKSHSSSSSVIFVSSAPTRPRSRHDPVKAFQNHASARVVRPRLPLHCPTSALFLPCVFHRR